MLTYESQSGFRAFGRADWTADQRYPDIGGVTSVCLRVTRACNLHCSYCQAPPNAKQLTVSELTNALSFLSECGIERVKFTGGEPFVYKGILPLIEECRGLEMEPTVVTNGTLLPTGAEDCLRRFRARVKSRCTAPLSGTTSCKVKPFTIPSSQPCER